jgi:hypothetical protein
MSDFDQTLLLQEIIDELIDSKNSIVSPLLKLNYFARLTNNHLLLEYTNNELNGYKEVDTLENIPKYRHVPISIYVELQIDYISQGFHPLPVGKLPAPFNNHLKTIQILEGISTLEKMELELNDPSVTILKKRFDMTMIKVFQGPASDIYKSHGKLSVIQSEAHFNKFSYSEILSRVRQNLLTFTVDVGIKFGFNISLSKFKANQKVNNDTIVQIMNTTITNNGDGNIVNTGANANLNITTTIEKGNVQKFADALTSLGIEAKEIDEIIEIVQTDPPNLETKTLGLKTSSWIGKMTGLAISGLSKVPIEIITGVVVECIKKFVGL